MPYTFSATVVKAPPVTRTPAILCGKWRTYGNKFPQRQDSKSSPPLYISLLVYSRNWQSRFFKSLSFNRRMLCSFLIRNLFRSFSSKRSLIIFFSYRNILKTREERYRIKRHGSWHFWHKQQGFHLIVKLHGYGTFEVIYKLFMRSNILFYSENSY